MVGTLEVQGLPLSWVLWSFLKETFKLIPFGLSASVQVPCCQCIGSDVFYKKCTKPLDSIKLDDKFVFIKLWSEASFSTSVYLSFFIWKIRKWLTTKEWWSIVLVYAECLVHNDHWINKWLLFSFIQKVSTLSSPRPNIYNLTPTLSNIQEISTHKVSLFNKSLVVLKTTVICSSLDLIICVFIHSLKKKRHNIVLTT